jgi:hypothetical protein
MTGVAVIINFHNGFSSSNYNLSACPRVGEIVHIAEFTYEVKAVNWLTIDGSMGQVATIFTSPVLVESLAGEFVDTSTEWIPQAGDVMSRVSGISQRVVGVEWFLYHQNSGKYSFARVHLDPNIDYQHPGIVAVMEGGQEYGERYVKAGISPM